MNFELFDNVTRQISFGEIGDTKYGHRFGGGEEYSGFEVGDGKPPVHLLFRLNTESPVIPITLPGEIQWLPLLCACRYGATRLGYKVISDTKVRILDQAETKPWDCFPDEDFPTYLPKHCIQFGQVDYDPSDPGDVFCYSALFGYNDVTSEQLEIFEQWATEKDLYDPSEYESIEDYVKDNHHPYTQGPPIDGCPNPRCEFHRRESSLETIAIFQAKGDEVETKKLSELLWGDPYGGPQLIFQMCPKCSSICATNQAT